MNNVWVFGDSYAEAWYHINDIKQWQHIVADRLHANLTVTGLGGSSLEYTYYKFDEVADQIEKNDVVIICLTSMNRKWFFKNNPDWSNNLIANEILNNDQNRAIKTYYTYLSGNDEFIADIHLKNFLYRLKYLTEKLELKTLVFPNFGDTYHFLNNNKHAFELFRIPNRTLYEVGIEGEMTNEFFKYWHYNNHDPRPGHMVRSNHIILAEKILRNIHNDELLDLTTGFLENIVDFDKEHDKEWCNYELFGQEWKWKQ